MIRSGRSHLDAAPHLMLFHGIVLMATVPAFTQFGDWLQEAPTPGSVRHFVEVGRMKVREIIQTDRVYTSRSHLSQAARWGDLVWTGGIGPLDLERAIVSEDMAGQARACLDNLREILAAAGTDLEHVLKVNVYLRRMEDFAAFEAVYKTFFVGDPPPRCAVACALGHPATEGRPGMDIEIEAVAGVGSAGADRTE